MRLTRLGLTCYGHFDARTLELDPRPGCINLIVAPNGAGKSVLRQAVSEMLFGIHTQTPMGFAFPYPKMRLRAEAERDGVRFGFIRRKGDLNTLTDLQERPADAALLARLPRKDDRKRLERLFMLDSAQLRAGGRALMQSDGDRPGRWPPISPPGGTAPHPRASGPPHRSTRHASNGCRPGRC